MILVHSRERTETNDAEGAEQRPVLGFSSYSKSKPC